MLYSGLLALGWCFALLAVHIPPSRARAQLHVPDSEGPCVHPTLQRHRHSHAKTQLRTDLSKMATHRRRVRELANITDTVYTLQFALLTDDNSPDCIESNVSVELSYRITPGSRWKTLWSFIRTPGACNGDSEEVPLPRDVNQGIVQFRWHQQEQAWGKCNCWQIDEVIITDGIAARVMNFSDFEDRNGDLDDDFVCYHYGASIGQLSCQANEGLVFCGGSASVPRGVVTPMYNLSTGDKISDSCTASDLFEPMGDVKFCDRTNETSINVSFQLAFHNLVGPENNRSCDTIESLDEGVELAIRRSEDEQWVPLKFYTLSSQTMRRNLEIDIGSYDPNSSTMSLRGYNVSVVAGGISVMSVSECICDERFFQEGIQFKWLQTVIRDVKPVRDTWFIDNVEITVHGRTEFFDNFSDRTSINSSLWPQVRNGQLGGNGTGIGTSPHCVPEGDRVLFFGATDDFTDTSVFQRAMTRMAVTKLLNLVPVPGFCDRESTVTSAGNYSWPMTAAEVTVSLTCVFGAVDDSSTGNATRECGLMGDWMDPDLSQCLGNISGFDAIKNITITAGNYDDVINELAIVVEAADFPGEQNEDSLAIITEVFLESARLVTMDPTIIDPEIVHQILEIVDIVQDWTNTSLLGQKGPGLIESFESTVIGLVEQNKFTRLVFTGESTSFIAERAPLLDLLASGRGFSTTANLVPATGGNQNTTFEELGDEQIASAYLPPGLFDELLIDENAEEVGVFFSIYEDAVLLPVVGAGNATIVGSPVVAATVAGIGPVRDLTNRTVILVRLNKLEFGTPFNPRCVSYDFAEGNWTTEGCLTIVSEEDPNVIRCECNHLTNFASLVDICSRTEGCTISPIAEVVLEVLSYIGVVLSMVGVILTIVTLLVFKKFRKRDASKFRVQLCIAIFCMLLVFVAGIDRTGNFGGCVTVSALIQYFTLAAVMWMGAEALLMFQKLVIVFIQITTKYIIGVSLVCWLVPIIPVMIPLAIDPDFMVTFQDNTDEIRFCFIGDIRVFFGAFFAPIFAILFFNSVIFVVVVYILFLKLVKKNKSKIVKKGQGDKKTALRLLISITGVMFLFGLTWLSGALTISDASLVFQIIFVIFNAFQGFFIFFFFCVLSREARELWKETLSCGRYKSKLLHSSHSRSTPSSGATKKPNNIANSNLLATSTLPKSVTSETTSESLEVLKAKYATLNGTSDKPAIATSEKTSPEKEEAMEEGSGTEGVEKKDEGGSLKVRVRYHSANNVGLIYHVESVEVDFSDSDDEDQASDVPA